MLDYARADYDKVLGIQRRVHGERYFLLSRGERYLSPDTVKWPSPGSSLTSSQPTSKTKQGPVA